MKLLLTSAGITNNAIAQALSELAGKPLSELSIIHIITAANPEKDDKNWIINDLVNLQKQNFKFIDILDVNGVTREVWQERLSACDIISFEGGNEQYLAHVFEKIGMKEFILSVLDTKVYMGTSAGSMVAGHFSPAANAVVYPEDTISSTPVDSLGLSDIVFIPHLNSQLFPHVRKDILKNIKTGAMLPIYATDDATAITVVDTQIKIVGTGDFWTTSIKS